MHANTHKKSSSRYVEVLKTCWPLINPKVPGFDLEGLPWYMIHGFSCNIVYRFLGRLVNLFISRHKAIFVLFQTVHSTHCQVLSLLCCMIGAVLSKLQDHPSANVSSRYSGKNPFSMFVWYCTVSGMVAASEMATLGFEVHVFESGRGLGGRMATRRGEAPVGITWSTNTMCVAMFLKLDMRCSLKLPHRECLMRRGKWDKSCCLW